MKLIAFFFLNFLVFCTCDPLKNEPVEDLRDFGRSLVEQGRTFVHHAVKRFMIILPAIFFKLGVAFTLLLLVTIVAVNNGFIGFLLLVVGLSSVLARLQEARRPQLPIVQALPPYSHHFIDRSDNNADNNVYTKNYATAYLNRGQYEPASQIYAKYVTTS